MPRLVNTTFFADEDLSNELLEWLRADYIAAINASGIFAEPLLLEITAHREPGTVSYAVQALGLDDDKAAEWSDSNGARLACDAAARWAGRVLCFTTIMNVIDQ